MSLCTTEKRLLSFDPTNSKGVLGEIRHFEWAIDHENQVNEDWCWAACLSNALSCFGHYVEQKEIVDKFFKDQGSSTDLIDDERIRSPALIRNLWRSFGFYGAIWKNGTMTFEALAQEIAGNGPVQIELWRAEDKNNRHLALIVGVREAEAGFEVFVSDPDRSMIEPQWYTYEHIVGTNPLQSNFGEWRRTYVNLDLQKSYLRRFFGRPSNFLTTLKVPDNELNAAGILHPEPVQSQLTFKIPPNPNPNLTNELALASYGYRFHRYQKAAKRQRPARAADIKQPLYLSESIPISEPPFEVDLNRSLKDQLRSGYRWHHQIHTAKGRPRYYAHADFSERLRERNNSDWRTVWIGERWLAERVDAAIRKLDSDFAEREGEVRMVWFGRHGLVTLLLPEGDLHCVVSAHTKRLTDFPLLEMFTDDELLETLRGLS
jgi:Papain-like cysteine protease AvrRpt2